MNTKEKQKEAVHQNRKQSHGIPHIFSIMISQIPVNTKEKQKEAKHKNRKTE